MKKYFLLLLFCFWSVNVFAVPAVEQKVDEILSRVKKEKNYAVITDYVHWETEYTNLPEQQKKVMQINSPEEYKARMQGLISNPQEMIAKRMQKRMQESNMPEDRRAMVKQMMEQQMQKIGEAQADSQQEISDMEYDILGSKVDGNNAEVMVMIKKTSGNKREKIAMQEFDGTWYVSLSEIKKRGGLSRHPQAAKKHPKKEGRE